MAILQKYTFFLLLTIVSTFGSLNSRAATNETQGATVKEIIECSMIRMAEQFHILENIDRTSKDQKIRAWIIKRIEHELHMMETVELTKDQQRFVRDMREHLAGQK